MANDRMFLRCACGDDFPLAKHMVDPWYTYGTGELEDRLGDWFEQHALCSYLYEDPSHYPTRPRVVLESDDDYMIRLVTKDMALTGPWIRPGTRRTGQWHGVLFESGQAVRWILIAMDGAAYAETLGVLEAYQAS